MELYATIKRTSKYAHQGRSEVDGKLILFPVQEIQNGSYAFRMGGNQYRREDLNFYVKAPCGELVKLHR